MDQPTVEYYDSNAGRCAARYESADMSHLDHLLLRHLPERGARVLELGCGSGREAAFLHRSGYDVRGVDASQPMIEEALRRHPELAGRLSCGAVPLPEHSPLLSDSFDAIIAIALLMHVPDAELFETILQCKRMLRPSGVVFISVSVARAGGDAEGRDPGRRLFRERPVEELQLLFERLGFRLAARYQTPDSLERGMLWHALVFQLDEQGAVRCCAPSATSPRRRTAGPAGTPTAGWGFRSGWWPRSGSSITGRWWKRMCVRAPRRGRWSSPSSGAGSAAGSSPSVLPCASSSTTIGAWAGSPRLPRTTALRLSLALRPP